MRRTESLASPAPQASEPIGLPRISTFVCTKLCVQNVPEGTLLDLARPPRDGSVFGAMVVAPGLLLLAFFRDPAQHGLFAEIHFHYRRLVGLDADDQHLHLAVA